MMFRSFCLFFSTFLFFLFCVPAYATDYSAPRQIGVSVVELQASLEKIGGPVVFAPRPGSTQGTQEARLPGNAGMIQATGGSGYPTVVVLWLPVDHKGVFVGDKAQLYLSTFLGNFVSDRESLLLWVDQVLKRAVAETRSAPYLESQLAEKYQLKAAYLPTLSPAMFSLTVTATDDN